MKTLEANSIRTSNTDGEMVGMDILSNFRTKFQRYTAAWNPVPSRIGSFDTSNA